MDAVPTNRIILRVKLSAAFYEVSQAASGLAALKLFRKARPDVVIAAANLPDMSGRSLIEKIRTIAGDPRLPVVLMHEEDDINERLVSLAAGADDVLSKPLDELVMLARLRSLLRARDAEAELQLRDDTRRALGLAEQASDFETPALVRLITTGRASSVQTLQAELGRRLSDKIEISPADEAQKITGAVPDVFVIIEGETAEGGGLKILPQIRSDRTIRHSSLIYVAQPDQRKEAAAALDMGANDLLASGPDPEELALRLKKQIARKRINDRLRANMQDGLRAAVCDPLTGLYNRRYALPHLHRLAERGATQGRDYALLLLDLDHFKSVNDTYGHSAGDAVLQEVSKRLVDNLRAADLVARYGGEEFLVAMPDTTREQAQRTAERLCRLMADRPVRLGPDSAVTVTLSIGVAVGHSGRMEDPTELIEGADRALYAAKNKGRNTLVMADTVTAFPVREQKSVTKSFPEPYQSGGRPGRVIPSRWPEPRDSKAGG